MFFKKDRERMENIESQFEKIKYDLRKTTSRLEETEKEIKQLKCPHKELEFVSEFDFHREYVYRNLKCKKCGKYIKTYSSEKEFNIAKAEYLRKQAEELEKKANDLEGK